MTGSGSAAVPSPHTMDNIWTLAANPAAVERAAAVWRAAASLQQDGNRSVAEAAQRVVARGAWSGAAGNSYREHRRAMDRDVEDAAAAATSVAGTLDRVAAALRLAQRLLGDDLTVLAAQVPTTVDGARVTFQPSTEDQVQLINASVAVAMEVRGWVDGALASELRSMTAPSAVLDRVAATWRRVAEGTQDGWKVPADPGPLAMIVGDQAIVNTGKGNDNVQISVDPTTGGTTVVVNGRASYAIPAGIGVTVRTGGGDDVVEVAEGTRVGFTVLAGKGQDLVVGGEGADLIVGSHGLDSVNARGGDDHVRGGSGNDYLEGGTGNDVMSGGSGNDAVYGGSGNDRIGGGSGDDYLEGGEGNDVIDGDGGRDVLSGGYGDDILRGGGDDDRLYAGVGRDIVTGGGGEDTAYAKKGDLVSVDPASGAEHRVTVELRDLGSSIMIKGSPEFVARVQDDLDMLMSSPRGQAMIAALDQAYEADQNNTVTIKETFAALSHASSSDELAVDYSRVFRSFPVGSTGQMMEFPPVVVLHHELAHIYDYVNDNGTDAIYQNPDDPWDPNNPVHRRGQKPFEVPVDERVAVGLPIDHDGDRSTPMQIDPKHPYDLTENGLREEMGLPHRPAY